MTSYSAAREGYRMTFSEYGVHTLYDGQSYTGIAARIVCHSNRVLEGGRKGTAVAPRTEATSLREAGCVRVGAIPFSARADAAGTSATSARR
jgi:hypothetical protein